MNGGSASAQAGSKSGNPTVTAQTQSYVVWGSGPNTVTTAPLATTNGSLILLGAGLWQWDTVPRDSSSPRDSKANTWGLIGAVSRPDNWPTAAKGVWSNATGVRGSNHTFTKDFGDASEVVLSVLEIQRAGSISNYAVGHIKDPKSANPTLTAPSVHANGPALLVVEFYGDQYVRAPTTAAGWVLVHEYKATSVSIHQAVFTKSVTLAGDYPFSAQLTGVSQGATTIAFAINRLGS